MLRPKVRTAVSPFTDRQTESWKQPVFIVIDEWAAERKARGPVPGLLANSPMQEPELG